MTSHSIAIARADLERLVALRSRQQRCSIAWGVVSDGELVLTGAHVSRTGSTAYRAHGVPDRLDDEELHRGSDPHPP